MARRRRGEPWFDEREADRVVAFFEKVLRHTDGIWAASPFILTDWQREDIIRPLYGWKRYDPQWDLWVRLYSTAWIELSRGNGKSEMGAGIVLEGLVADGEEGAEVYGAADDRDQATVIFRVVDRMVQLSPILSRRLKRLPSVRRIVDPVTNSFYQALPRDQMGTGAQGFKMHVGVVDEVQVQKTKALIDALQKSKGKRVQPLFVMITTAGNTDGPAKEEHDYSAKVASGEIEDPSRLVYIRSAEPGEDPFDERVWHKANPALGDFLSIATLRQEALEARHKPSELNAFLQYRLNIWVRQVTRFISMEDWDASAGFVDEPALRGKRCRAGMALTSAQGMAALVLIFRDEEEGEEVYKVVPRFWIPGDDLEQRSAREAIPYDVWVRRGLVTRTEGNTLDFERIGADLDALASRLEIVEIAHHPWNAVQFMTELHDQGMPVVAVRPTFGNLSPATKALETAVVERRLHHGGNPVLRFMADAMAVRTDSEGNVKPDAQHSAGPIQGMVALVMALSRAMVAEAEPQIRILGGEEE